MKTKLLVSIIGASAAIVLVILLVFGSTPKQPQPFISPNDPYCGTIFEIRLNTPTDHAVLEAILKDEIAKLGPEYDISEREIRIESLGDALVKVTIGGLWQLESGAPDLGAAIESIEIVRDVENYPDGPVQAWCQ